MQTKWMVREQTVANQVFYQAYRYVFIESQNDNLQTYGGLWKDKKDAIRLCGRLNGFEKGFRDEVLP